MFPLYIFSVLTIPYFCRTANHKVTLASLFCRSSGISLRGYFGFVLAALWPSAQLAIIAGRFRLALAGDFTPASGTVADQLDFVDGAFHGITIPDTLGYSERIQRAQKKKLRNVRTLRLRSRGGKGSSASQVRRYAIPEHPKPKSILVGST
jgi:hypothetical protein